MKTYDSLAFRQRVAFIFIILATTNLSAQQQERIQLQDKSNESPIIEATWQYEANSGVSDEKGVITFHYSEGREMILSHLRYGSWILTDSDVKKAIQSGFIRRTEKTVNLSPVTVIALRTKSEELESLALDYEDKMAHDGGAILNRTPAISGIRKSAAYGYDPVLRGFKYDQLNIVLNGAQSSTAACPNRMDPPTSQMAPNMMERIEVLKGPHALRYGTSFGGTVNYVAATPDYPTQFSTYGRLSGSYDSNGDIFRSEGLVGFNGQRYDLGIFGSLSQGNDYRAGDDTMVPADFWRASFGTNLGLRIGNNQDLTLSATYNRARDVDFAALPMDLRKDETWLLNAQHKIALHGKSLSSWSSTIYGTMVDHMMNNGLKNLDPRMVNAETVAKTSTYGGRTEGFWNFGKNFLYSGADLRIEEAEGTRVREFLMGPNAGKVFYDNAWQNGRISKTGIFAEFHTGSNSIQLTFSGRLEFNNADVLDPADEFTNVNPETDVSQVNPNVSLGAIKNLKENMALGLWLGRGQRSGSLTERFINYFPVGQDPYEMLGNPQLDPEINNQVDLTYEIKTESSSINVDIFMSYLQDMISAVIDTTLETRLPNSPGVRRFVNIENAFKTGFEMRWIQSLAPGLQHRLSVAYTYGQDLERDEPLPEIAPLDFRYSLFGSYVSNKLWPEVTLRHVLEQTRISKEFGEIPSPAFTLIDVKVSYRFSSFKISTGVQNVFDIAYYEHLNRMIKGTEPRPIFEPGRNFFLSLTLDLM